MEDTPGLAMLHSLDGLLRALDLEQVDRNVFVGVNEAARFPRVFGGQLAAQAMQAAALTVDRAGGSRPHSIHATYLRSASSDEPITYAVEGVRDGRTTATRQVTASQDGRAVLIATVSFHANLEAPVTAGAGPLPPTRDMPGPEGLPTLADWAEAAPSHLKERARRMWVEMAPPLDVRVGEAFTFLGGSQASGPRSHWIRLPRRVDDDPTLHAVLLTYASDYFLLDMAVRTYPARLAEGAPNASTLEHSVWLHRPVRFDRWHRYTQDVVSLVGARGLVMGAIHDEHDALVATAMQQVLILLPEQ